MEGSTLGEEGVRWAAEQMGQLLSPEEDAEDAHGGWRSTALWVTNGPAVLFILKVLQVFCERLIKCAQVRNLLCIRLRYKAQ